MSETGPSGWHVASLRPAPATQTHTNLSCNARQTPARIDGREAF